MKSDSFVLLDTVRFSKESYINRTKIKTPQGEMWLTVPVVKADILNKNIIDVRVFRAHSELSRICKTIRMNYAKARYFDTYFANIESTLLASDENLCELNIRLIQWLCEVLNIKTPLHKASSFDPIENEDPTERLVRITQRLNGTVYLSGSGGFGYQDPIQFEKAGIALQATNFKHQDYQQLWGNFVPGLSVLDLIFNHGKNSASIIRGDE